MACAVGGLDGVEGFVDLLFGDAFYVASYGGYGRRLAGLYEAAHDGEDGGCGVALALAEDVGALLAHEDHRAREGAEDGDGVVGVAEEETALF